MTRVAIVLVALLGCGDELADPEGCLPDGTATVTGSVMGRAYAGPLNARQIETGDSTPDGNAIGIVIDNGTCSTNAGDSVLVELCVTPAVGSYPIAASLACPGGAAFMISQDATGGDEVEATAGTVVIQQVGNGCVRGSYSVMFGGEPQTAMFDAVVCP